MHDGDSTHTPQRPCDPERGENKIRAAIEAGEFDNLLGIGKPAAICDEPYDPYWWVRRKLQREGLQDVLARR